MLNGLQDPDLIKAMIKANVTWFEQHVVARLLRDRGFRGRMSAVLNRSHDGADLREFSDPACHALSHVAASYGIMRPDQKDGDAIDMMVVETLLTGASMMGQLMPQSKIVEYVSMTAALSAMPMDAVKAVTDIGMCDWMVRNRFKSVNALRDTGAISAEEACDLLAWERGAVIRALSPDSPLLSFGSSIDCPPPPTTYYHTGFSGWDRVVGGLGLGESTMVIAASGVGKTAFATQLASQVVLASPEPCILYISTEEKTPALERRIISQTCRVAFKDVKAGVDLSKFSRPQMDSYQWLREQMDGRLVFKEWVPGTPVVEGLETCMRESASLLKQPASVLILDWIGGAISDDTDDDAKIRRRYIQAADYMARMADKCGFSCLCFAQAHPDRGINRLQVDARSLSETKLMTRNQVNVVGITGLLASAEKMQDEQRGSTQEIYEQKQFLYVSKARKSPPTALPVMRNMAFQRFEDPGNGRWDVTTNLR